MSKTLPKIPRSMKPSHWPTRVHQKLMVQIVSHREKTTNKICPASIPLTTDVLTKLREHITTVIVK